MVIAEEAYTEYEDTAEGVTGKHLAASTDALGKRVDALQDQMKQQHDETKQLLAALMSRLGERDGVVVADAMCRAAEKQECTSE